MSNLIEQLIPEAKAAGIHDYDALRLADESTIRIGAGGKVTNAREVVKALKAAKPHLFQRQARDMTPQQRRGVMNSIRQAASDMLGKLKLPAKPATEMTKDEYAKAKGQLGLRHQPSRFSK